MNYSDKGSDYFANVRSDLLRLLNKNDKGLKAMEIGAGYGETLYYLKETGQASEAVGVDIFEDIEGKSNYKPIDRFIFGNIEQVDFPEYHKHFDLILLPDVLEHLIEPGKVLAKVKAYLADDGQILVSMPNIRHYSAFKKIFLKGDFKYENSGIFDYTHMRFYCKKNMADLLVSSGFEIVYSESSIKGYKGRSFAKVFNMLTFGMFEEFLSVQYFFTAKKQHIK